MKTADWPFARKHQAGKWSLITELFCQDLVHAGGCLYVTASHGSNSGQDSRRSFRMTTAKHPQGAAAREQN